MSFNSSSSVRCNKKIALTLTLKAVCYLHQVRYCYAGTTLYGFENHTDNVPIDFVPRWGKGDRAGAFFTA